MEGFLVGISVNVPWVGMDIFWKCTQGLFLFYLHCSISEKSKMPRLYVEFSCDFNTSLTSFLKTLWHFLTLSVKLTSV